MSEPNLHNDSPADGLAHELISGMSALNMEASPIADPPDGAFYLSETDAMAKHAMAHFQAAFGYLGKLKRIQEAAARLLVFSGLESADVYSWTFDEMLAGLAKLEKAAREAARNQNDNQNEKLEDVHNV